MEDSDQSQSSENEIMADPFAQELKNLPAYWHEMTEQVTLTDSRIPFLTVAVPAADFWKQADFKSQNAKLDATLVLATELSAQVRALNTNMKTVLGMPSL